MEHQLSYATNVVSLIPRDAARGLGSRNYVCLSVRLSVTCVLCDKTNNALRIFWYQAKGQSLKFSETNSGWWATPLPSEICAQSDPPPSKRWLWQISANNVSTVRQRKSSITTSRKSTTGFPTSYKWNAYVTPRSHKGAQKANLLF